MSEGGKIGSLVKLLLLSADFFLLVIFFAFAGSDPQLSIPEGENMSIRLPSFFVLSCIIVLLGPFGEMYASLVFHVLSHCLI